MSQLVRLEGKHTYQNAHCAVAKSVGEDEDDLLKKDIVMCVLPNDLIISIQ